MVWCALVLTGTGSCIVTPAGRPLILWQAPGSSAPSRPPQSSPQQETFRRLPDSTPDTNPAQVAASSSVPNAETGANKPKRPPGEHAEASIPVAPLQLPDVNGIRLGMKAADALAAVRRAFPQKKIEKRETKSHALIGITIPGEKVEVIGFVPEASKYKYDSPEPLLVVDITDPPLSVVYRVEAQDPTGYETMPRSQLLARLRQKFGKESPALTEHTDYEVGNKHFETVSESDTFFWFYNLDGKAFPATVQQKCPSSGVAWCRAAKVTIVLDHNSTDPGNAQATVTFISVEDTTMAKR